MVNAAEMRMGLGDVSPRHPGVAQTVLSMLQSARRGLAEAADESAPPEAFDDEFIPWPEE